MGTIIEAWGNYVRKVKTMEVWENIILCGNFYDIILWFIFIPLLEVLYLLSVQSVTLNM